MIQAIASSLKLAKAALPQVDALQDTEQGISLLSLKIHLLINYLQHLTFFILLKARNESIKAPPYSQVIENLIDLRIYLDKGVKPIEAKLKYQIDKVIRAADRSDVDETTREALSYKPNPKALVTESRQETNQQEAEAEAELYKPPKIAATVPTKRVRQNVAVDDFVDEIAAAPRAQPSIGSNIITRDGVTSLRTDREAVTSKERQVYEEANYTRLPDTKRQRRSGPQNAQNMFGGEEFGFSGPRVLEKPTKSALQRSRDR